MFEKLFTGIKATRHFLVQYLSGSALTYHSDLIQDSAIFSVGGELGSERGAKGLDFFDSEFVLFARWFETRSRVLHIKPSWPWAVRGRSLVRYATAMATIAGSLPP
jgi:hypothetical protein